MIEDLVSRGVEFGLFGEKVRFRDGGSLLTIKHVEFLKAHRREVARYLLQKSDFPYGKSRFGNPVTWTGKIVRVEAWRGLSEWERHGSTGKMWSGLTRQWEEGLDIPTLLPDGARNEQ